MNELIEIEYKILITKDIFEQIIHDYQSKIQKDYIQTNYYFTHPLLQQKAYMLRIREKNNELEMTLKRPYLQHRIETNVSITKQEKDNMINHIMIDNEIIDILKKENIPPLELQQQFSLITHRYDIPLEDGLLSIDKNTYLGQIDYEIEFEVQDETKGFQTFLKIIEPYHLNYQGNCKGKIRRVLDSL